MAQFDPIVGHEQGGPRPALIVSADAWNGPPGDLVTVLPVTSKPRNLPSRVRITPPEGGLTKVSWAICEQVRTVSTRRLLKPLGSVTPRTMQAVSDNIRMLLDL